MQRTLLWVLLGIGCISLSSARLIGRRSLVVTTETTQEDTKNAAPTIATSPQIYQMRVDTNVSNRYAVTLVTSKVRNIGDAAQEATFSVVTPDQAFISGFTMEIDGKKYKAYVQEKEEARETYDRAVESGFAAAHVAASARDSNRFTVSVNIQPASKATFYLTYEELLVRKDEKYEIVLNIHPGEPVKDLLVQVNIDESRPLKFVKTPSLRSGNELLKNNPNLDPEAEITNLNETSAVVRFNPDIAKQRILAESLGGKEKNGLSGQFIVQYDVARDPEGGEVLVSGGHFVHFFSPENLTPLKKQVIFVLDTSGSMSGVRITQLKEAMDSILDELKPEDVFSIVEFNSLVKVWDVSTIRVSYMEGEDPYIYSDRDTTTPATQVLPPSFPATESNIINAKEVVKQLDANGGTDIQSALKIGLNIETSNAIKIHQPIIVFLTDGEPTVGESNTERIVSSITALNTLKVPIFSLSFGDGADREFLKKLSLKNQGFSRHIYEAADAYIQLQDFYKQISSPLLSNVTFRYTDQASNVTKSNFPILFGGGELFTTGILRDDSDPSIVPPAVEAWGVNGPIQLQPKVFQVSGNLERLWAYLTVRQLLEQREVAEDKTGPTQEALRLALKYSFVTDVSSLVVVKPNDTATVDTVDAAESFSPSFKHRTAFAAFSPMRNFRPAIVPTAAVSYSSHFGFPILFSQPARDFLRPAASPIQPSSLHTFIPDQHSVFTTSPPSLSKIPWLGTVRNTNGTITVGSDAYSLDYDPSVTPYSCQNSLNKANGTCLQLMNCEQIYPQLTDFDTFKKYFCKLDTAAGVCCPDSPFP
ncbi:inter-alpha-trypsin inhibitor heavy chain H4 isoform X1 [Dendroctonus ponderosae]|uniref:inter-alpha-trypsin inhibitor heavy chain H4 isoform X1 n=1 Tax=Dendroctonus ponderosae TaxID=77166 RepID=UPI002035F298|nr:inter-alpha-trypsin inhibitor heavy chain H4 isoform X1 [Dendroctonus ponderosae]XP_048518405.1 inter-alpha-trypsin inhibitor heavy chain H4 isoform X1 [Dendroctonus ponderosae]XP_048518406.1 inter-alpha-trypsin inhibitor heavy chain H4 isoform X1 [Dendroctonus ponderosae]